MVARCGARRASWCAPGPFPACRSRSGMIRTGRSTGRRTSTTIPASGATATGPGSPEHDGLVILGRSDATLNPGGVRIGTAEIYRQVEQLPEVVESLVVGQEWEGDVRIVLFVRLREGLTLDPGAGQPDPPADPGVREPPPRAAQDPAGQRTSPAPSAARSPSWRSGTSSTAGRWSTWTPWPTPRPWTCFGVWRSCRLERRTALPV